MVVTDSRTFTVSLLPSAGVIESINVITPKGTFNVYPGGQQAIAAPGDWVQIDVMVRNNGQDGDVYCSLLEGANILVGPTWVPMLPSGSTEFIQFINLTMPNHSWSLTVEVGY